MKSALNRAKAYLDAMPPAVSGSGGHKTAFAAATVLRHGFALPDSEAWSLFLEYNQRCQPPWNSTELKHKFDSVDSFRHPMRRGYLAEKGGVVTKRGRNKIISSPLLTRSEPRKRAIHSPKTLGVIKLPDQYLAPVEIEIPQPAQKPTALESESFDPPLPKYRPQTPPEGCCSVCWNRWGRYLREMQCICTGDVIK